MNAIHLNQWKEIIIEVAQTISTHEKKLNDLDSLIGDGDHGSSMKRGFEAVRASISESSFASVGELFSKIGSVMMWEIGGAIGPLLGSFFLAAAKPAKDITETDLSIWSVMFTAGVDRIRAFGKAQCGDKTILDALQPAHEAFLEASHLELPVGFAFRNAAQAARTGADLTSSMVAKFGRAKFLGERSLGHQDPGANSMYFMLNAMADALARLDEPGEIDVREAEDALSIETEYLKVKLQKKDALLEITTRKSGHILKQALPFIFFSETGDLFYLPDFSRWYLENNQVILTCETGAERKRVYLTINFPLPESCQVGIRTMQTGLSRCSVKFVSSPVENFFGGGERFSSVNQRGKRLDCWASDRGPKQKPGHPWTYWPVPFFISNQGYGFLVHNNEKSVFDLCASDPSVFEIITDTPNIRFEIFWAEQPIDNIGLLLQRTGRPPLPPKWNNGVWVTCLGGEEAVLEKAHLLRKEHIPCSALWVYDANDPKGNIGWPICPMHHSGNYHDVPGLVDKLHAMGFKVQTYLFPYFYVDTLLYAEADRKGYFFENADGSTYQFPFWKAVGREGVQTPASIIDFTNPEAKSWWQGLIRYTLVDLGYDGWMHDFAEDIPEEVIAFNGLTGAALHNLYPVLYQQAAREACLLVKPEASFYARSGFTGSQAWLTAAWPGDQICTWEKDEGLSSVLPACLSLSLCGMFFIGPDIGGYFGRGVPQEANSFSKELWIRWTQLGALSSIMRDHLGDKPDGSIELWTDQETLAIFKQYAGLHMSLSPYIQGCANQSIKTGHPIMRHMFLVEPDNSAFWNCDDQYLFGDAMLVAPVLQEGARSRSILLPAGHWIDYWDRTFYEGGQEITLPAPLDRIPLLVKEGAVLPTLLEPADSLVESSDESVILASDDLKLQVYLPLDWKNKADIAVNSHRELVDGTVLDSVWEGNTFYIKIRSPQNRTYLIVIPGIDRPKSCELNGRFFTIGGKSEDKGNSCWYDADLQKIYVHCTEVGVDLEITC
jgi:dihydroxyacetone kinase phosphoprotein-dependent L subunit